jgi:gliding motility-associated-like protein
MLRKFLLLLFMLLIFCHVGKAQGIGKWAYMRGDTLCRVHSELRPWDSIGYRDYFYACTNNITRSYSQSYWKLQNGFFYCFGGFKTNPNWAQQFLNNVSGYNTSLNYWIGLKYPVYVNTIIYYIVHPPNRYQTKGVASVNSTPSGRQGSLTWTDATGDLWLYGGEDTTGLRSDMWKFNIASQNWMWVSGDSTANNLPIYGTKGIASINNSPGGRSGSITHWVDKQGNFYLFGGKVDMGGSVANDLWKFNPITKQWTWINGPNVFNDAGSYGALGIAAATNLPSARDGYAASQDTAYNLLLFGGMNHNDAWHYNLKTNKWTWVAGTNQINNMGTYIGYCQAGVPGARHDWRGAQLVNNLKHLTYLFAGTDQFDISCNTDLWVFDSYTNQFKWLNGVYFGPDYLGCTNLTYGGVARLPQGVSFSVNRIPGRSLFCMVVDNQNKLFVFTGKGCDNHDKEDVWRYDPDTACLPVLACHKTYFTQSITICKNDTFVLPMGLRQTVAGTYKDTIMNWLGCDSIITTHLATINYKLSNKNVSICANKYYTLHNGKKINLAGVYKDTIPSTSSCDSIYTINLSTTFLPTKNITASICSNQTYTLPSGKMVNTAGLYKDTIANAAGCDSVISIQLLVNNINNTIINKTICSNQSYQFNNQTLTTSGIYHDTLVNKNGCDSLISLQLVVNSVSNTSLNSVICSNQFYTLPNGLQVSKQGIYKDTLLNISGCDSFITINLSVIDLPNFNLGNDTNLCAGNTIILSVPHYAAANYLWNNHSLNNSISVDTSGFYDVTVSMPPCASVADSIQINFIDCDCKVLLPNSFTPNNDGIDETFKPIIACDVEPQQYEFKIYNRLGQKVFTTTLFGNAWDGTFNGSLQEIGTYVFFVSFINPTTQQKEFYKGDVILIR